MRSITRTVEGNVTARRWSCTRRTRFDVGKDGTPLVLVSDPGQDLDDEMLFIMLSYLIDNGFARVLGIVATLAPARDRARLTRGTLDTLGLHHVPVGWGSDGGDTKGEHRAQTFEEWARWYMPPPHSESAGSMIPGRRLLHQIYVEAQPRSLTLCVIASLKDPAIFLRDNEELFLEKTCEVVIMGGVEPWDATDPQCLLKPDNANNNTFDFEASKFFYQRCQELAIPLIVVSRWAAYAAKVPRSCYDELAALGSSIGCRLRNAQRKSIENLWSRAASPVGSVERMGLPDRCDRSWFLNTFCSGADAEDRRTQDTIWDLVDGFMQYDTIAVLAAIPQLRDRFFSPCKVMGLHNVPHRVIGRCQQQHDVCNAQGLRTFMGDNFVKGLAMNLHPQVHFVLLTTAHWHHLADDLLALTVLRTLYNQCIIDCAAIILTSAKNEEAHERLGEVANEFLEALANLGLRHIPLKIADSTGGSSVVQHLVEVYSNAPPGGVTLILNDGHAEVAEFAEQHPTLFRGHTQTLIVRSHVCSSEAPRLRPHPDSSNSESEHAAKCQLFSAAQDMVVPMLIMSRYFFAACNVPRALFEALKVCGSSMGARLYQAQRASVERLWAFVNAQPSETQRSGLPSRVNRAWFISAFCQGKDPSDENDIWSSVKVLQMYSPLELLAALPTVLGLFVDSDAYEFRSATHRSLGKSESDTGVMDAKGLRSLLYQCLFQGIRLNASEFHLASPPPLPLTRSCEADDVSQCSSEDEDWKFDASEDALTWLLPWAVPPSRKVTS